jgi:hypothetical protein
VLGPSGLRHTQGRTQRRWSSSLQGHSDEEKKSGERESASQGGVTRRPNPKRSKGAILSHQKGRRNGGRHSGVPENVLLRGRRRNERLGHLDKPNALVLKRNSGGRRGGRDSKSFAATRWRRRMLGGESRRGAHAVRESFTHLRRPLGDFGQSLRKWRPLLAGLAGGRRRTLSAKSLWLAADDLPLRSQTGRQRKRTTGPARGVTIRCGRGYWRSRVCP